MKQILERALDYYEKEDTAYLQVMREEIRNYCLSLLDDDNE